MVMESCKGESLSEFVRCLSLDGVDKELNLVQLSEGDVNCVVWDAAIALSKYLDYIHENKASEYLLRSKSVVELGAGTGCVGLTAAFLGASSVTLTDLPEYLDLLKRNHELNIEEHTASVHIKELTWGNSDQIKEIAKPDLILVADCVYYKESVDALIRTLQELCSEHTKVLLSYEERTVGENPKTLEEFLTKIEKVFNCEEIPIEHHHPIYQSPEIHILKYTLKET